MTKRFVQHNSNGPERYALYNGFKSLVDYFAEITGGPEGAELVARVARNCDTLRAWHSFLADVLCDRRCLVRGKREAQARLRTGTCDSGEAAFIREKIATLTFLHPQVNTKIRRARRYLASFPISDLKELEDFEKRVKSMYAERCERERQTARNKRLSERLERRTLPVEKETPPPQIAATLIGDEAALPAGFVSSDAPVRVFVCKGPLSKTAWQRLAELHRPGIVFRFLDRDGTQFDDAVISTPANRSDECYVLIDVVSRGSNARLLSTLRPYDRAPRLRKVA